MVFSCWLIKLTFLFLITYSEDNCHQNTLPVDNHFAKSPLKVAETTEHPSKKYSTTTKNPHPLSSGKPTTEPPGGTHSRYIQDTTPLKDPKHSDNSNDATNPTIINHVLIVTSYSFLRFYN